MKLMLHFFTVIDSFYVDFFTGGADSFKTAL